MAEQRQVRPAEQAPLGWFECIECAKLDGEFPCARCFISGKKEF